MLQTFHLEMKDKIEGKDVFTIHVSSPCRRYSFVLSVHETNVIKVVCFRR